MMNIKCWSIVLLIVISFQKDYAQCNQIDFELPANSCLDQKIKISSNSNLTNYSWDLCAGDFDMTPNVSVFSANAGSAFKVKILEQSGLYYGFYLSRNHRKLFRLDFGNNVKNTPSQVDLGGLGVDSNGWLTIDIVNEGGIYYGLIIDFYNSIFRFYLGTSLTNSPSSAEILYQNGLLANPIDLVINEDEVGKYAFIANYSSNKLLRLSFGVSFASSAGSIIKNEITISGSAPLSGLSFIQDCNVWYLMATSQSGGQISKIIFDDGLEDSTPSISQIAGLTVTPTNPAGVALAFENGKYHAFIQSQAGQSKLYKIDFGNSMANSVLNSIDYGNFGMLNNIWGFSMYKAKSDWMILSSENTGPNMYRITFPNNCFSNEEYSTSSKVEIPTIYSGTYNVSLTSKNIDGYLENVSKTITVSTSRSPDIMFDTQGMCVSSPVSFAIENISGDIIGYSWSFGDASTSSLQAPVHQYATQGEYTASLMVEANNGCKNSFERQVKLYDPPVSAFTLPVGLICTNNEFTFTNNTIDNFEDNLTYQWLVDDLLKSSSRDLQHAFASVGNHQVKLKASIPGCTSEVSQTLTDVQTGPMVDFSFTGKCVNEAIEFINNSSGDISSFEWDFGNGEVSSEESPSESYSSYGNYIVSLNTIGTNGCVSAVSKQLDIYSVPNPSLFIDLPPFSCSGTPTQFHDYTPALTDSNIISWAWTFNDGSGATSNQKDPLHTFSQPGIYNVDLSVTTNYGCSASTQLPIEIAASPNANFNVGPACLNKPTQFENVSSPGIKSWSWIIGNSFYTFSDPVHTFTSSGSFPVTLIVQGVNDCEASFTKTVEVKPIPLLNFSTSPACTGLQTIFTDQTSGTDLPASWLWDFGGGSTSTVSPASFVFSSAGAFPVGMTVTTNSGCSYSLSKNVVVAPSPVASFTESATFGPPPLLVQFTNTSTNSASVLWEFNDALSTTSTSQNPLFTFSGLGDYLVQLTASNGLGCSDTFSKTIKVIVPVIDISLENLEVLENFSGQSFTPIISVKNNSNVDVASVDVFVTGGSGARIKTNVAINLQPGSSSELVVPLEIFSKENYLCVELMALGDINSHNNTICKSFASKSVIIPPYPNPTSGTVFFETVLDESSSGELKIFDSKGKLVFIQTYPDLQSGMNRIELDFSGNNPGVYLAFFEAGGQKAKFRLIFQ